MADLSSTFAEAIINKYPADLLKRRNMIEGNMIACLWKNPELYKELGDLTREDFITKDGLYYYDLGSGICKKGFKVFDAITVATYLADKPTLEKNFNQNDMANLTALVDMDNVEGYYDELVKGNILLRLHEKGFNVVKELPKFDQMNAELVYQHFDYQLNDVFVKKQLAIKPVDMTSGYDSFLADCDTGKNLGKSFASACPILNYHMAGLHKGNMLLHTAHSGVGKTSSAIVFYLLPLLEAGEKIVVIANEQGERDWRSMIIPTVISNKLHHYKFPRQRMQYGSFTEEDWKYLNSAKQWLNMYAGNLVFVQLHDYSISTIKKIIHKYKAQGYENFIYDTAKPEDETSDKAWAVFTENSKELFQIANKEDIVLIATAQLSMMTLNTRFVNGTCIGKSKAIKEVASQIIMIRDMWKDEYTGGSKDIKPYDFMKNQDTGKYTSTKRGIDLDPAKKHGIIFVDKNRFGKDGFQLVYEKNLDFNTWSERGFCEPHMF